MILIELSGGLGNQMFQYAFGYVLASKNNTILKIDNDFFNKKEKKLSHTPRNFELYIFNNSYVFANSKEISSFDNLSLRNKFKKKLGFSYPKIYQEKLFNFQPHLLTIKSNAFVKGYFQSYKYFEGFEKKIKKIFYLSENTLDEVSKKILVDIKCTTTISIHLRRGDYVSDTLIQQIHGNCSMEYYTKAINFIASKIMNNTLVFFSDDIEWVESQFENLPFSKIFVNHNFGVDSWRDLFLMKSCNHNIIANSSFSWWAAWLNENPNKIVVAPKKWFAISEDDRNTNDLIPPQWIRL
jgi:hypothetical protein